MNIITASELTLIVNLFLSAVYGLTTGNSIQEYSDSLGYYQIQSFFLNDGGLVVIKRRGSVIEEVRFIGTEQSIHFTRVLGTRNVEVRIF